MVTIFSFWNRFCLCCRAFCTSKGLNTFCCHSWFCGYLAFIPCMSCLLNGTTCINYCITLCTNGISCISIRCTSSFHSIWNGCSSFMGTSWIFHLRKYFCLFHTTLSTSKGLNTGLCCSRLLCNLTIVPDMSCGWNCSSYCNYGITLCTIGIACVAFCLTSCFNLIQNYCSSFMGTDWICFLWNHFCL